MAQVLAAECSTILFENKPVMAVRGLQKLVFRRDLLTTGLRVILTQSHVTSDTRLSRFLVCNIEKLGKAWGQGYMCT